MKQTDVLPRPVSQVKPPAAAGDPPPTEPGCDGAAEGPADVAVAAMPAAAPEQPRLHRELVLRALI